MGKKKQPKLSYFDFRGDQLERYPKQHCYTLNRLEKYLH